MDVFKMRHLKSPLVSRGSARGGEEEEKKHFSLPSLLLRSCSLSSSSSFALYRHTRRETLIKQRRSAPLTPSFSSFSFSSSSSSSSSSFSSSSSSSFSSSSYSLYYSKQEKRRRVLEGAARRRRGSLLAPPSSCGCACESLPFSCLCRRDKKDLRLSSRQTSRLHSSSSSSSLLRSHETCVFAPLLPFYGAPCIASSSLGVVSRVSPSSALPFCRWYHISLFSPISTCARQREVSFKDLTREWSDRKIPEKRRRARIGTNIIYSGVPHRKKKKKKEKEETGEPPPYVSSFSPSFLFLSSLRLYSSSFCSHSSSSSSFSRPSSSSFHPSDSGLTSLKSAAKESEEREKEKEEGPRKIERERNNEETKIEKEREREEERLKTEVFVKMIKELKKDAREKRPCRSSSSSSSSFSLQQSSFSLHESRKKECFERKRKEEKSQFFISSLLLNSRSLLTSMDELTKALLLPLSSSSTTAPGRVCPLSLKERKPSSSPSSSPSLSSLSSSSSSGNLHWEGKEEEANKKKKRKIFFPAPDGNPALSPHRPDISIVSQSPISEREERKEEEEEREKRTRKEVYIHWNRIGRISSCTADILHALTLSFTSSSSSKRHLSRDLLLSPLVNAKKTDSLPVLSSVARPCLSSAVHTPCSSAFSPSHPHAVGHLGLYVGEKKRRERKEGREEERPRRVGSANDVLQEKMRDACLRLILGLLYSVDGLKIRMMKRKEEAKTKERREEEDLSVKKELVSVGDPRHVISLLFCLARCQRLVSLTHKTSKHLSLSSSSFFFSSSSPPSFSSLYEMSDKDLMGQFVDKTRKELPFYLDKIKADLQDLDLPLDGRVICNLAWSLGTLKPLLLLSPSSFAFCVSHETRSSYPLALSSSSSYSLIEEVLNRISLRLKKEEKEEGLSSLHITPHAWVHTLLWSACMTEFYSRDFFQVLSRLILSSSSSSPRGECVRVWRQDQEEREEEEEKRENKKNQQKEAIGISFQERRRNANSSFVDLLDSRGVSTALWGYAKMLLLLYHRPRSSRDQNSTDSFSSSSSLSFFSSSSSSALATYSRETSLHLDAFYALLYVQSRSLARSLSLQEEEGEKKREKDKREEDEEMIEEKKKKRGEEEKKEEDETEMKKMRRKDGREGEQAREISWNEKKKEDEIAYEDEESGEDSLHLRETGRTKKKKNVDILSMSIQDLALSSWAASRVYEVTPPDHRDHRHLARTFFLQTLHFLSYRQNAYPTSSSPSLSPSSLSSSLPSSASLSSSSSSSSSLSSVSSYEGITRAPPSCRLPSSRRESNVDFLDLSNLFEASIRLRCFSFPLQVEVFSFLNSLLQRQEEPTEGKKALPLSSNGDAMENERRKGLIKEEEEDEKKGEMFRSMEEDRQTKKRIQTYNSYDRHANRRETNEDEKETKKKKKRDEELSLDELLQVGRIVSGLAKQHVLLTKALDQVAASASSSSSLSSSSTSSSFSSSSTASSLSSSLSSSFPAFREKATLGENAEEGEKIERDSELPPHDASSSFIPEARLRPYRRAEEKKEEERKNEKRGGDLPEKLDVNLDLEKKLFHPETRQDGGRERKKIERTNFEKKDKEIYDVSGGVYGDAVDSFLTSFHHMDKKKRRRKEEREEEREEEEREEVIESVDGFLDLYYKCRLCAMKILHADHHYRIEKKSTIIPPPPSLSSSSLSSSSLSSSSSSSSSLSACMSSIVWSLNLIQENEENLKRSRERLGRLFIQMKKEIERRRRRREEEESMGDNSAERTEDSLDAKIHSYKSSINEDLARKKGSDLRTLSLQANLQSKHLSPVTPVYSSFPSSSSSTFCRWKYTREENLERGADEGKRSDENFGNRKEILKGRQETRIQEEDEEGCPFSSSSSLSPGLSTFRSKEDLHELDTEEESVLSRQKEKKEEKNKSLFALLPERHDERSFFDLRKYQPLLSDLEEKVLKKVYHRFFMKRETTIDSSSSPSYFLLGSSSSDIPHLVASFSRLLPRVNPTKGKAELLAEIVAFVDHLFLKAVEKKSLSERKTKKNEKKVEEKIERRRTTFCTEEVLSRRDNEERREVKQKERREEKNMKIEDIVEKEKKKGKFVLLDSIEWNFDILISVLTTLSGVCTPRDVGIEKRQVIFSKSFFIHHLVGELFDFLLIRQSRRYTSSQSIHQKTSFSSSSSFSSFSPPYRGSLASQTEGEKRPREGEEREVKEGGGRFLLLPDQLASLLLLLSSLEWRHIPLIESIVREVSHTLFLPSTCNGTSLQRSSTPPSSIPHLSSSSTSLCLLERGGDKDKEEEEEKEDRCRFLDPSSSSSSRKIDRVPLSLGVPSYSDRSIEISFNVPHDEKQYLHHLLLKKIELLSSSSSLDSSRDKQMASSSFSRRRGEREEEDDGKSVEGESSKEKKRLNGDLSYLPSNDHGDGMEYGKVSLSLLRLINEKSSCGNGDISPSGLLSHPLSVITRRDVSKHSFYASHDISSSLSFFSPFSSPLFSFFPLLLSIVTACVRLHHRPSCDLFGKIFFALERVAETIEERLRFTRCLLERTEEDSSLLSISSTEEKDNEGKTRDTMSTRDTKTPSFDFSAGGEEREGLQKNDRRGDISEEREEKERKEEDTWTAKRIQSCMAKDLLKVYAHLDLRGVCTLVGSCVILRQSEENLGKLLQSFRRILSPCLTGYLLHELPFSSSIDHKKEGGGVHTPETAEPIPSPMKKERGVYTPERRGEQSIPLRDSFASFPSSPTSSQDTKSDLNTPSPVSHQTKERKAGKEAYYHRKAYRKVQNGEHLIPVSMEEKRLKIFLKNDIEELKKETKEGEEEEKEILSSSLWIFSLAGDTLHEKNPLYIHLLRYAVSLTEKEHFSSFLSSSSASSTIGGDIRCSKPHIDACVDASKRQSTASWSNQIYQAVLALACNERKTTILPSSAPSDSLSSSSSFHLPRRRPLSLPSCSLSSSPSPSSSFSSNSSSPSNFCLSPPYYDILQITQDPSLDEAFKRCLEKLSTSSSILSHLKCHGPYTTASTPSRLQEKVEEILKPMLDLRYVSIHREVFIDPLGIFVDILLEDKRDNTLFLLEVDGLSHFVSLRYKSMKRFLDKEKSSSSSSLLSEAQENAEGEKNCLFNREGEERKEREEEDGDDSVSETRGNRRNLMPENDRKKKEEKVPRERCRLNEKSDSERSVRKLRERYTSSRGVHPVEVSYLPTQQTIFKHRLINEFLLLSSSRDRIVLFIPKTSLHSSPSCRTSHTHLQLHSQDSPISSSPSLSSSPSFSVSSFASPSSFSFISIPFYELPPYQSVEKSIKWMRDILPPSLMLRRVPSQSSVCVSDYREGCFRKEKEEQEVQNRIQLQHKKKKKTEKKMTSKKDTERESLSKKVTSSSSSSLSSPPPPPSSSSLSLSLACHAKRELHGQPFRYFDTKECQEKSSSMSSVLSSSSYSSSSSSPLCISDERQKGKTPQRGSQSRSFITVRHRTSKISSVSLLPSSIPPSLSSLSSHLLLSSSSSSLSSLSPFYRKESANSRDSSFSLFFFSRHSTRNCLLSSSLSSSRSPHLPLLSDKRNVFFIHTHPRPSFSSSPSLSSERFQRSGSNSSHIPRKNNRFVSPFVFFSISPSRLSPSYRKEEREEEEREEEERETKKGKEGGELEGFNLSPLLLHRHFQSHRFLSPLMDSSKEKEEKKQTEKKHVERGEVSSSPSSSSLFLLSSLSSSTSLPSFFRRKTAEEKEEQIYLRYLENNIEEREEEGERAEEEERGEDHDERSCLKKKEEIEEKERIKSTLLEDPENNGDTSSSSLSPSSSSSSCSSSPSSPSSSCSSPSPSSSSCSSSPSSPSSPSSSCSSPSPSSSSCSSPSSPSPSSSSCSSPSPSSSSCSSPSSSSSSLYEREKREVRTSEELSAPPDVLCLHGERKKKSKMREKNRLYSWRSILMEKHFLQLYETFLEKPCRFPLHLQWLHDVSMKQREENLHLLLFLHSLYLSRHQEDLHVQQQKKEGEEGSSYSQHKDQEEEKKLFFSPKEVSSYHRVPFSSISMDQKDFLLSDKKLRIDQKIRFKIEEDLLKQCLPGGCIYTVASMKDPRLFFLAACPPNQSVLQHFFQVIYETTLYQDENLVYLPSSFSRVAKMKKEKSREEEKTDERRKRREEEKNEEISHSTAANSHEPLAKPFSHFKSTHISEVYRHPRYNILTGQTLHAGRYGHSRIARWISSSIHNDNFRDLLLYPLEILPFHIHRERSSLSAPPSSSSLHGTHPESSSFSLLDNKMNVPTERERKERRLPFKEIATHRLDRWQEILQDPFK